MEPRAIAILGATGSIGTTTLQVVRAHPTLLRVAGLAARSRWRELVGPVREFKVGTIALADTVVLLDGGRVAATGTHDELLAHSERYRAVLAAFAEDDAAAAAGGAA